MTQQHISLGTPPNGTDGDTNRTAWVKAEANFDELYDVQTALAGQIADVAKGFIQGLKLEWLNASAIRITSGFAHVEGEGELITLPAAATRSGLTLSANAWHHVYLFLDGASADVELSTTGPATPYIGSARSKSGDTSRRYIGSVRTDASGAIYNFAMSLPGTVLYREPESVTRVLSNGTATIETTIALASRIPVTAATVSLRADNNSSTEYAHFGVSTDSASGPPSGSITSSRPQQTAFFSLPPDSAQAISYWYPAATASGAYVAVMGYTFER